MENNEEYTYEGGEVDEQTVIEIQQTAIRNQRLHLLRDTDYLAMRDYPLTNEKREAVEAYRQALRDITLQPSFAQGEVEFPTKNF